ncbi:acyl-CoA carboxylase subunit epsilon [Arthrobacter sp. Sr24]
MTAAQSNDAPSNPYPDTPDTPDRQSPTIEHLTTPLLKVTRGNPSAEELAAVTAVVLALQVGEESDGPATQARPWARRARLHLPPKPGAGSWRRSNR